MANIIRPQRGPQERFLACGADICIYGGAAGGGKTYGLLLEALRNIRNPGFNALIFRRDYTQITSPGGLWDSSKHIYSYVQGSFPLKTPKLHWQFRSGASVNFAHLGRNEDCEGWQGSQIALIGFDELTHFTEYMFFYMLSRNRSTCGVRPYVRATCNPDADSWVAKFIEWWIDPESGYPIKERSGKIRWMVRVGEKIHWAVSKKEAVKIAVLNGIGEDEAATMPKSVTFIASTLNDNRILMKSDPSYLANLQALPLVEKERLLYGNWKIKPAAGMYFKRTQIGTILKALPSDIIAFCRGWDLAATDEDEDQNAAYTAGVLMAKRSCGRFLVVNVINRQIKAGEVRKLVMLTAQMDQSTYGYVRQRLPQDPGQAGKEQAQSYVQMLAGYDVVAKQESGSKESRAEPMASQWQLGFFDVMEGSWNEPYFDQLESFPESKFKDMVDASSSAFNELTLGMAFNLSSLAH